jgi:predicted negative regulator of RcsB-dependent stress response
MVEEYLTDDEQLEEVKRWLKENGAWIVGGVLVGAALIFGWRYYGSHQDDRALAASSAFSALNVALDVNDKAKARQLADAVIQNHAGSPYADQAKLVLARLDVDDGKLDAAMAPLGEVMNGSKDVNLRSVARLRLARVQIAAAKPDEALKTLADPIPAGFAGPYHEVRGDAQAAKKATAAALTEYQAALAAGDAVGLSASVVALKIQDLGGAPTPASNTVAIAPNPKAKP